MYSLKKLKEILMINLDSEAVITIQNCKHNEKVIEALENTAYVAALVSNISCKHAEESLSEGPFWVQTLCSYSIKEECIAAGVKGFDCNFTTTDLKIFKYAVLLNDEGSPIKL